MVCNSAARSPAVSDRSVTIKSPLLTFWPSRANTWTTTPPRVDLTGSAPRTGTSVNCAVTFSGNLIATEAIAPSAKTAITAHENPRAAQCGGARSRKPVLDDDGKASVFADATSLAAIRFSFQIFLSYFPVLFFCPAFFCLVLQTGKCRTGG